MNAELIFDNCRLLNIKNIQNEKKHSEKKI